MYFTDFLPQKCPHLSLGCPRSPPWGCQRMTNSRLTSRIFKKPSPGPDSAFEVAPLCKSKFWPPARTATKMSSWGVGARQRRWPGRGPVRGNGQRRGQRDGSAPCLSAGACPQRVQLLVFLKRDFHRESSCCLRIIQTLLRLRGTGRLLFSGQTGGETEAARALNSLMLPFNKPVSPGVGLVWAALTAWPCSRLRAGMAVHRARCRASRAQNEMKHSPRFWQV